MRKKEEILKELGQQAEKVIEAMPYPAAVLVWIYLKLKGEI